MGIHHFFTKAVRNIPQGPSAPWDKGPLRVEDTGTPQMRQAVPGSLYQVERPASLASSGQYPSAADAADFRSIPAGAAAMPAPAVSWRP